MVDSNFERDKNLIKNQNFLTGDPEQGYPVTPCMDVYKAKIQSYESINKLRLRIIVRGDLKNKELIGDTWATIKSMGAMKYLLSDTANHKAIVHQLDLIGAFIQANVKHRFFVKF